MQLLPYQQKAVSLLQDSIRLGVNTILTVPTGGGKSVIAADLISKIHDKKVVFAVHRVEICNQFSWHLRRIGIKHGMLTADSGLSEYAVNRVVVASFDTLAARVKSGKINPVNCVLICDESHHILAHTYRTTIERFIECESTIIGMTATPQRLDGHGFAPMMKRLITPEEIGADYHTLVKLKRLVYPKIYSTSIPDLTDIGISCGDYTRTGAFEAIEKAAVTGQAIDHYLQYAKGTRAAVFCINKIHAEKTLKSFQDAGISAGILYSGMSDRDEIVNDFRSGKIAVLITIDIISEGFDLPEIDCCIMLRPTMSLTLFLQQIGRAVRFREGKKHAILIDAVGNIWRHGPPWIEREWSLEGTINKTENGQKGIQIARCAVCFAVYDPKREACPFCGSGPEKKQRMIKTVDGTLKLVYNSEAEQIEAQRAEAERLKSEQEQAEIDRKADVKSRVRAARTKEDLQKIARENGYKPGWVYYWCRLKRIKI